MAERTEWCNHESFEQAESYGRGKLTRVECVMCGEQLWFQCLSELGANIASAAALCLAFELGGQEERDTWCARPTWWPGCGRDAK